MIQFQIYLLFALVVVCRNVGNVYFYKFSEFDPFLVFIYLIIPVFFFVMLCYVIFFVFSLSYLTYKYMSVILLTDACTDEYSTIKAIFLSTMIRDGIFAALLRVVDCSERIVLYKLWNWNK